MERADHEGIVNAPAPEPRFVTLCISTYPEDRDVMDAMVDQCKRAGLTRMSRSQLLRIALKRLDLEQVIAELRDVR